MMNSARVCTYTQGEREKFNLLLMLNFLIKQVFFWGGAL